MKNTYEELVRACTILDENGDHIIDMRLIEAECVDGHDVSKGPCCCGAWH